MDVLGYVLVWEGIYSALVDFNRETSYNCITSYKLASISLCEKENANVLIKKGTKELLEGITNPKIEIVTAFLL